jgi:hypothetical protein
VGAVFQDFGDRRRGAFMDLGSALSPALGGSPALALAPDLVLEASELSLGQGGQPPDDLLYHPPLSSIVYADIMIIRTGASRRDPAPLDSQHGAG